MTKRSNALADYLSNTLSDSFHIPPIKAHKKHMFIELSLSYSLFTNLYIKAVASHFANI